ncbi:hypothetical protein [Streptomyces aureoverticillatus]|uniref:hypothetical protein n=1 Tax=Streptomyces aureoverticillatus TaxID=66871 RepID=UPI0013DA685F|nr:hypothetical protein [Streptomyces aureoverticillatus]QIB49539.1 hypothetical protein G3H79_40950 [Streptomyces aureoverticillatus]
MQSSTGDQASRTQLTSNVSGVQPAGVLLYLNVYGIEEIAHRHTYINASFECADALDWHVIGAINDNAATDVPRGDRSGWRAIVQFVENPATTVDGIVFHSLDDLVQDPAQQDEVRAWAARHGCFIKSLLGAESDAAAAVGEAGGEPS